jgi:hypothetical protein
MKKFISTIVLFSISFVSLSQTIKISKDEFTNQIKTETSLLVLKRTFYGGIAIRGYTTDENFVIKFSITDQMSPTVLINSGNKVYFKLEDGNIISLENKSSETLSKSITARLKLSISKEDIDKMIKSPVSTIRIETSDDNIDIKGFSEVKTKKLQKLLGLMRSNI